MSNKSTEQSAGKREGYPGDIPAHPGEERRKKNKSDNLTYRRKMPRAAARDWQRPLNQPLEQIDDRG